MMARRRASIPGGLSQFVNATYKSPAAARAAAASEASGSTRGTLSFLSPSDRLAPCLAHDHDNFVSRVVDGSASSSFSSPGHVTTLSALKREMKKQDSGDGFFFASQLAGGDDPPEPPPSTSHGGSSHGTTAYGVTVGGSASGGGGASGELRRCFPRR